MKQIEKLRGVNAIRKARKNGEFISAKEKVKLQNFDKNQSDKKMAKIQAKRELALPNEEELIGIKGKVSKIIKQPSLEGEKIVTTNKFWFCFYPKATIDKTKNIIETTVVSLVHQIKEYFGESNIKYGMVCKEHNKANQIHFQGALIFYDTLKISGKDFNEKLNIFAEIDEIHGEKNPKGIEDKDETAAFIYNLKEGEIELLNEVTKTELYPNLLAKAHSFRGLMKVIHVLIKNEIISGNKILEIIKYNFTPNELEALKTRIDDIEEEELGNVDPDLTIKQKLELASKLANILAIEREKILFKFPKLKNIKTKKLHDEIIYMIRCDPWLVEPERLLNHTTAITEHLAETLRNYHEVIELFIISTLIDSFEKFAKHEYGDKSYAIYAYSHSVDMYKSTFWKLFRPLYYCIKRPAGGDANFFFPVEDKLYKNFRNALIVENDANITNYSDTIMKNFVDGDECILNIKGKSMKRTDETIIALTANPCVAESFRQKYWNVPGSDYFYSRTSKEGATETNFNQPVFSSYLLRCSQHGTWLDQEAIGWFSRLKEISASTGVFIYLFFKYQPIFIKHEIPFRPKYKKYSLSIALEDLPKHIKKIFEALGYLKNY